MSALQFLRTLSFLSLTVYGTTINYPFPYPDNKSPCDNKASPPPIISFHVHSVFDGTNKTIAQSAVNLYYDFIQFTNPKMKQCLFSHANAAPFQNDICFLPFNASMDAFPFFISHIFGGTDYAFFIPKQHYLTAEMWWRQHNDPSLTHYMFHPNTGCEDKSHTIWSMTNEGYPFPTNKTGLFCCHNGPLGCYCDITQYAVSRDNDNDALCIAADYADNTVLAKKCGDSDHGQYDETTWRETYYNDTFIQIENYGTMNGNTYMCLGQDDSDRDRICKKGNRILLMQCSHRDSRLTQFNWIDTGENKQKIKALECTEDLCLDFDQDDNEFVLRKREFFPTKY